MNYMLEKASLAVRSMTLRYRASKIRKSLRNLECGSVSLPFDTEPVCRTFLHTAYPLGILGGHEQLGASLEYYFTNFRYIKPIEPSDNWGYSSIFPGPGMDMFIEMGFLESKEATPVDSHDVIKWILESISAGYYIYCRAINEFFVAGTTAHRRYNKPHQCLIIGYLKSGHFKICTYFKDGSYGLGDVEVVDICMGLLINEYRSTIKTSPRLVAIRPKGFKCFHKDANVVQSGINNFLLSRDLDPALYQDGPMRAIVKYQSEFLSTKARNLHCYYGRSAVEVVIAEIRKRIEAKRMINMNATRGMWEQKKVLYKSIADPIGAPRSAERLALVTGFKSIVKWYFSLHMLGFQYNSDMSVHSSRLLRYLDGWDKISLLEASILTNFFCR